MAKKSSVRSPDVKTKQFVEIARSAGDLGTQLEQTSKKLADFVSRAEDLRRTPRFPGALKGKLVIHPSFFDPLTEEELNELTGS